VILHCDLNCFYASVELLSHPELREVPVAVCGDPEQRHGIILAKNEPAKKLGVKTAETIWQAKQKCPDLILLPPHHELYSEYSKRVNAIYYEYTDLVEPFGIDESWLDVTGSLHLFGGDAKALADTLRERIRREQGLTISVGVSFNKVFAKLGSYYKKPDATTVIPPDGCRILSIPCPWATFCTSGARPARYSENTASAPSGSLPPVRSKCLTRFSESSVRSSIAMPTGRTTLRCAARTSARRSSPSGIPRPSAVILRSGTS
jgi:DNA polymerase-4